MYCTIKEISPDRSVVIVSGSCFKFVPVNVLVCCVPNFDRECQYAMLSRWTLSKSLMSLCISLFHVVNNVSFIDSNCFGSMGMCRLKSTVLVI